MLSINDPGYQDFRHDANCIVRPQSLIGEKFVECDADRRSAPAGAAGAADAREDRRRAGQGPVPAAGRRTRGKSVDLDLINNIMRLPVARSGSR